MYLVVVSEVACALRVTSSDEEDHPGKEAWSEVTKGETKKR